MVASSMLLFPAIGLLLQPTLAATAGEFNVLSMNVAGLPAILNDNDVPGDKTTNAETIGSKSAEYGYDVIHVQEVKANLKYESFFLDSIDPLLNYEPICRISTIMRISTKRITTLTARQLPGVQESEMA